MSANLSLSRLLLFTALTLIGAVLFIFIPPALSRWLFLLLIGGCVVWPAYRYRHHFQEIHQALSEATLSIRNSPHWPPLFTILACFFMILSTLDFDGNTTYTEFRQTFKQVMIGGVFLGIAILVRGQRHILPYPHPLPIAMGRGRGGVIAAQNEKTRWIPLLAGILMLAALAEMNHPDPIFPIPEKTSPDIQFLMLAGGIAGLIIGLGGRLRYRIPLQEALPVLAITLLALVLRFWQLDTMIHRLVDEIHFMNGITQFWQPEPVRLLQPFGEVTAFPAIYPYLEKLTVSLFGRNLLGLRAISALFGALTIPALYLLAQTLFDHRTGLIAALFLTVMPVHLHFSRLALNNIADPLFGTLALAFMARAYFSHRRLDFTLAGISLGLTQYFYEGGRLLFPPLMLVWIIIGVVYWRVPLKGILITAFAALMVAAPVYYTLNSMETSYAARMDVTSMSRREWFEGVEGLIQGETDPAFEQNFTAPLLVYFQNPDGGWFYGEGNALLVIYLVPALMLGVCHILWRFWQPAALLLIAWVAATTLGNSFLHESDWSPRFLVVLPDLALIAAVGVRYTIPLFALPRGLRNFVLAAVVAGLSVYQFHFFFYDYVPTSNRNAYGTQNEPDDALFRATALPDNTTVYIIDNVSIWNFNIYTFRMFFNPTIEIFAIYPELIRQQNFSALPADGQYAFLLDGEDSESLAYLRLYFDLGEPESSPYNISREKQMVLYRGKKR